jgi:transcriptional regulator with PAS, ATPase and Fis domain
LRVLQERIVERVGSNAPIPLDVRLIAASNQDLMEQIRAKRFRDDLFYRLAVVRLYLPPLRLRREDIPLLVPHFLDKHGGAGTHAISGVSREFMDALQRYDFPGNVRELENLVHSAIVLSRDELLTTDDLPVSVRDLAEEEGHTFERFEGSLPQQVEALERRLIAEALAQAGGVQYRAAEHLGISERTLRYKIEKYAMK